MSIPVYLAQLADTLSPGESDYSAHDSIIHLINVEAEARHRGMNANDAATLVAIAVIVIVFGGFLAYNYFNNRYWQRGIFPPMMLNRRSNHYEAVINIGMNILRTDRTDYIEKQEYLGAFMRKKFPDIEGSMANSIRSAIDLPVTVASVAHWLNKHTKQQEKEEFLAFFFTLALLDDLVGMREQKMLREFAEKMKLEPELERMLNDQRREKQTETPD